LLTPMVKDGTVTKAVSKGKSYYSIGWYRGGYNPPNLPHSQ
jgi:hypothetical protein